MTAYVPPLDPDAAARIAAFGPLPPMRERGLAAVRDSIESAPLPADMPAMAAVEDGSAPGPAGPIPLRIYRPSADSAGPAILYFHGGGLVMGTNYSFEPLARVLAAESGATVVAVGYRLAPECPPPAQFDDCLAPLENLVGQEGQGFTYAMIGLDGGRINISACSLGGAQAALDRTLAYMGERQAFGRTIDQFQALQFRLADMEIELQAARTYLRQAAWKLDQKAPDATKFCAMAKKFVTEAGSRVADQCLQLHGGYGYLADYGIEKIVRDLRVHQILEGTNEIMRLLTVRALLAERG